MVSFITKLFKKKSAPAPTATAQPKAALQPAAPKTNTQRRQQTGRQRTIYTNPLGLSEADKSSQVKKYLTGA